MSLFVADLGAARMSNRNSCILPPTIRSIYFVDVPQWYDLTLTMLILEAISFLKELYIMACDLPRDFCLPRGLNIGCHFPLTNRTFTLLSTRCTSGACVMHDPIRSSAASKLDITKDQRTGCWEPGGVPSNQVHAIFAKKTLKVCNYTTLKFEMKHYHV
jgi:hypothetical protein